MTTATTVQVPVKGEEWMRQGLCTDFDPDLWFPDPDDHPSRRQARTAQAQKICSHCPVRAACLRWAFETGDEWAVLGGRTANQRTRVRHRMERGNDAGSARQHDRRSDDGQ